MLCLFLKNGRQCFSEENFACRKISQAGYPDSMRVKKNIQSFDFYCILFFVLACIGWIWEVVLTFFTEHAFVNRGIYKGPYLPIYGVGGMLLYFLLYRYRKKPLPVFMCSLVVCSALEYFAGWLLEVRFGRKWWDYSGHFMNLNGRICLLGALCFGLGGTLLICLLIPLYERVIWKVPEKARVIVCILLILFFVADAAYCAVRPNTGYGITTFYVTGKN